MNTNYTVEQWDNSIKFTIPVTTTSISEFWRSVDANEITGKVHNFVVEQLKNLNRDPEIIRWIIVCEIFDNSFDSYVSFKDLAIGAALEFSAHVKRKGSNIVIQFKDNGKGLTEIDIKDVAKTKVSDRKLIEHDELECNKHTNGKFSYHGGAGKGLAELCYNLRTYRGTLNLKKREN